MEIIVLALFFLVFIGFIALVLFKLFRKKSISKEIQYENVVLHIRVPKMQFEKHNELQAAPIAAEQLFSSLHGLLKETPDDQEHISFEIASSKDGISFYFTAPKHLKGFVESQIYAQYPDAQITLEEDFADRKVPIVTRAGRLALTKDKMFPIKTFIDFEVDPLAAITSSLSNVENNEHIWLQFLVRPVPDGWQEEGYKYIKQITEGAKAIKLSLPEMLRDALGR